MDKTNKKLVLIDGNALMHRAYHALPPLTTKKGELVNAVYGFTSVLLKVIKELKPDYMVCAFDVAGGTFRDKIYKEYKAGRIKPDQEFYGQIPKIKEVVKTLNIPILEKKGFEADDIIGSLVKQANSKFQTPSMPSRDIGGSKFQIIIVTGDLDTLQLIDENTNVYTLRKGIKDTAVYDRKAVMKRYGLEPRQIIDFKALRGDPSDNIPGVKGIGEKGAIKLLKNFGSLENLYRVMEKEKNSGLIKPKVKEKLVQQKKEAFMSKKLATIRKDVDIKLKPENCVWGNYNKEKLNQLFRELEFYTLLDRVEMANHKNVGDQKNKASQNTKGIARGIILDNDIKIDNFLLEIEKQEEFVFKTHSDGESAAAKNLRGLVFLWKDSPLYYIPFTFSDNKPNLFNAYTSSQNSFLRKIKSILEDEKHRKIGYDLKNDFEILYKRGINLKGLDFDIMLAAYLLNPGKRDYSEDKIVFEYLGRKPSGELVFWGGKNERAENLDSFEKIVYYLELYEKLKKELGKSRMENLFYRIEIPLVKVLAKMEINGVKIDTMLLKNLSTELSRSISNLRGKIHKLSCDESFNINSSQQLSQVLFDKMKLPITGIKRTQTGYSVAASELDKLREEHIIIDFISQYRELTKLKNTYIDALPKLINGETKKLHTTFHQTVTATGRLSSSDPNLQNIPIRTEIGRKIRKAFISETGRKLLSADYSQIELRIIAMISGDKKMREIFNQGLDVHVATAAEVNQIPVKEVTQKMRQAAKALNFGVIYGMSVYGFAQSAGIDRDRAKEFIDNYMKKFSAVAKCIEKSKEDAGKKGYAETLWGRRRYLPEINSSNAIIKNAAERMAINMPIQGTAADIIKIAMIKIDRWMEEYNRKNKDAARLLLQVHDELLFSVKNENLDEAAKEIKKIMENSHIEIDGGMVDFPVPIKVDIKVGDNWEQMEKVNL